MSNDIRNPDRRDFLKGLVISAGGCAFGSTLISSQEAMAQSIAGYMEEIPMEARWERASGGLVRAQVILYKTVYDKEGREKFIEERKETCPGAAAGNKRHADRFGLTGNDAKSAAAIIPVIVTLYYGPQQKYEIGEATAEKARVRCVNCAFWNTAQSMKITEDLCSDHCRYYWGGFAGAINTNLSSTLIKARPLGDSFCEWVLELRA